MKKVFIIACSTALFGICSLAQAQQTTDTASANYHYQKGLEKTGDDIERGTEKAGDKIEQGAQKTEDAVEQGAANTDRELNKAGDKASENADKAENKASQVTNTVGAQIKDEKVESKVGPNGEPIFITEDAEYYYIGKDGQKVMVKKSELRDKPDND